MKYKYILFCGIINAKVIKRYTIIQKYCIIEIFVISLYYKPKRKDNENRQLQGIG